MKIQSVMNFSFVNHNFPLFAPYFSEQHPIDFDENEDAQEKSNVSVKCRRITNKVKNIGIC